MDTKDETPQQYSAAFLMGYSSSIDDNPPSTLCRVCRKQWLDGLEVKLTNRMLRKRLDYIADGLAKLMGENVTPLPLEAVGPE